jgi:glycosyltransferase involved in cell wall biosynthesis
MIKFRRKITVIHSQGFVAGTVGIILGRIFRKKTILSDHTVYFYNKNSLTAHAFAYIANQHDVVLAVSELAKKELITWGVKIKKIKPFRYWVNNSLFKPIPKKTARLKLGLKPDVFYVLNVSRLHKAKGLDILVKTAETVYKKDKGIIFLIVNADTNDPKTFLEFVGKTSLPPNCRFIGPIDNRKTNIWFNAANLLIVTSKKEGYSRVNIESMLCGTPVIANRVGSLIEVLNERVAVFVDKDNPSEFSRNIVALANNQKKLETLSINALEYARANFTKQSASRIYETYK